MKWHRLWSICCVVPAALTPDQRTLSGGHTAGIDEGDASLFFSCFVASVARPVSHLLFPSFLLG